MTILLNKNTRVIVQGITGKQGRFHTQAMLEYGTKIVAGVTPGKGGEKVYGIPVYNTIEEALIKNDYRIDASIIFVPGPFVLGAVEEIINAKTKFGSKYDNLFGFIVIITEHVPVWDVGVIVEKASDKGIRVIGPNCPGLISPGESKIGIIPGKICKKGNIGIVSRSGTLTYEIIQQLTKNNLGQSTAVGIGGDPIHGMDFIDVLKLFENDEETKAIILIGEIGGTDEEDAAEYIKKHISKPVIAYIAGVTAPKGKQMGHAGAIITMDKGTAQSKIDALKNAGVFVAEKPADIPKFIKEKKVL
ncbi:MAG: succinate--CoA ligase subunit alpha [Promethearchaeota archaeon]